VGSFGVFGGRYSTEYASASGRATHGAHEHSAEQHQGQAEPSTFEADPGRRQSSVGGRHHAGRGRGHRGGRGRAGGSVLADRHGCGGSRRGFGAALAGVDRAAGLVV